MKFFSAYDRPDDSGVDCSVEPSMTKQSFKDECDINNIMARFERTGVLDFVNEHEPRYGDATALDYQTAMQIVAGANSMFADMPAQLRSRFDNDPAKFLEFVENPANDAEAIQLGIKTAPKTDQTARGAPTASGSVSPQPNPPTDASKAVLEGSAAKAPGGA